MHGDPMGDATLADIGREIGIMSEEEVEGGRDEASCRVFVHDHRSLICFTARAWTSDRRTTIIAWHSCRKLALGTYRSSARRSSAQLWTGRSSRSWSTRSTTNAEVAPP